MPLLTASDLNVSYGDVEVFSDVSLEVAEGARIGLVGPNGGGKTSLLRVLVGHAEPSGGHVYGSSSVKIAYVPQVTPASAGGTIRDEVMLVFREVVRLEDDIASAAMAAGDGWRTPLAASAERRYSSLLARYEALGGHDYMNRTERVADGVGLTPQTLAKDAETASGGERTRAALAAALLAEPDLLVLDEPTNYLDFRGLAWLEKLLDGWHGAFVVVSHDRFFLDATVRQVWDLSHGRLRSYRAGYAKYRALRTEQAARQAKEYERQQEAIAREQAFIDRYRAGQRAREAKGREKRLARLGRIEAPDRDARAIHVAAGAVSRGPRVVAAAQDLRVGFLVEGVETELVAVPDLRAAKRLVHRRDRQQRHRQDDAASHHPGPAATAVWGSQDRREGHRRVPPAGGRLPTGSGHRPRGDAVGQKHPHIRGAGLPRKIPLHG